MPKKKTFSFVAFLINILIPLSFGVVGGLITKMSIKTWYPYIEKPSFNPAKLAISSGMVFIIYSYRDFCLPGMV
ncbi:tryptophan-rich sensory protein [Pedobacter sp. NJ-S-72]